jgi:hypothetical protein
MKTKLLKKLRKKFDWKYRYKGNSTLDLAFYIYDKKTNLIFVNNWQDRLLRTDLEFLLEKYGNLKLLSKYNKKEAKKRFNKL